MVLWTLLVWLAVGAVAGILARKIMGGTSPLTGTCQTVPNLSINKKHIGGDTHGFI